MSTEPHFLVVDGYSREGREDLAAGGATTAGELYRKMLESVSPGCTVDVIYPADPGVSLPVGTALEQYDGLAWTGSSLTVWKADDPNVIPQIELMKSAYRHRVPSFGSCWAVQIGAVAAGGRCVAHPYGREMGIARKIFLTAEGQGHPLYHGKPAVFDAFISHDDEVTHLPPGAVCLASNAYTRVQAVAITHQGGVLWAVQYHPEYDLHELARLMHCRTQKLIGLSASTPLHAATAQAIVDLGRTLNVPVVAQGVDCPEALKRAHDLRVPLMQGNGIRQLQSFVM